MDSDVDRLREILNKKKVKHYDKLNPSPPVIYQGHRGVWRTIAPFGRVFIELKNGELGNVVAGNDRLKGKTFDEAAKEGLREINARNANSGSKTKTPERLRPANAPKDTKEKPRLEPVGGGTRPPTDSPPPTSSSPDPDDSSPTGLAGALALLDKPGKNRQEAVDKAADALLKAARETDDDLVRRRLEKLAYGMKSGALKTSEVRSQLRDILEGTPSTPTAVPSQNEVNVLHDRVELQETIDNLKVKVEEAVKPTEVGGNTEDARNVAMLEILEALESIVRTPQVKTQIKQVIKEVRNKRLGGNSVILRLLQILRFLLAFVPG